MSLKRTPTIIVLPIFVAVATLTWKMGYDSSENRVKTLEARGGALNIFKDLQLPTLLADLRQASKQLGDGLESSRRVTTLQEELEATRGREQQLKQQLTAVQAEKLQTESKLRKSEEILNSLYPHVASFTLQTNESQDLLGYDLAVGLVSVLSETVEVTFDNREEASSMLDLSYMLHGEE